MFTVTVQLCIILSNLVDINSSVKYFVVVAFADDNILAI